MRWRIFTFLFLGSISLVYSQNLKGIYVLNEITKAPISSVLITDEGERFQYFSDENGWINLQNTPLELQKIYVSGIGYEKEEFNFNTIQKNKGFGYVYLNPKVVRIEEVQLKNSARNNIFQTISDLDIHLRPINNSQEILRSVPGLFIGQHAGGGKAEQLFIRGFDVDHGTDVAISVDGMPVNMVSHAHGQGYADLHFVIPEMVNKVNFDKGPYFADKGNFTTAGFVDFKTKDFLEQDFAKLEIGQFQTYRGVFGLNLLKKNKEIKDQSLFFATEVYFTNGYFQHSQNFNRFNGMLKYHGKINDYNFLTVSLTGFNSQWNASGQVPDRAVEDGTIGWFGAIDSNEGGKTSRYNFNAQLKTYLKNGGKLTNQFFYSKYQFELYSNFTFFLNDPLNGDQIRQKEDRNLYGFHSTYEKNTSFFGYKSETTAGVQLRYDEVNNSELSRTKDRAITTTSLKLGDVQEMNFGAFWSQKISLNNRLDITPSIRFDGFNNQYKDKLLGQKLKSNSAIFSPQLKLNYRLSDNVQLYSYFGKGFHSNDTRVAVLENGKKVLPPALGTDFGGVFKIGKKLILQSALWYLWLDQEFIYVGDEAVVEQGGKTERMGIDLSARYEIFRNWFADFNLSWAKPKSLGLPSGENYIPLAPKLVSTGGVTYRKERGFNGSLRYRLMGDRPANEDNTVVAKGYFVWDGTINYTTPKWELGWSVQNIFNVRWKETQFDTESKLQNEALPVSEIHFTPGTPFFSKLSYTYFF